jgi:hypothetical protein
MRPVEFLSVSSVMVIGLHDVFRVIAGTATAGGGGTIFIYRLLP